MTPEEIDTRIKQLELLKEATVQQANVDIGRILGKIELLKELREEKEEMKEETT